MDKLTVATLKAMYQSKKTTPQALIEELIERTKRDQSFNIWITPPSLSFIQPYLDALEQMDPEEHPLWGIPFAIKDNIDLVRVPTSAGCPAFTYTPGQSADVVARLIEAGAIPIGKTNLDQFATGLVGTRSPYGETHNALNQDLISGGSSSGSAVAVARGQVVFSLGTDTAGSGRVPAALNDLIGYKASIGAWSVKGVVPACASLDCVTVFANSLDDAYLVDSVARGGFQKEANARAYEAVPSVKPRKLLLPKEPLFFYGPHEEAYRNAWDKAVRRLEQFGIPVEYTDWSLFSEVSSILYDGPWIAERWSDLGEFVESHPGEIFPVTEAILRSSQERGYDAASVFTAQHQLREYKERSDALLKDAILVMPTCGGTYTREEVARSPVAANSDMGYYTNHCNLLDMSAIALPSDYADQQLPFGITMFALRGQDSLLRGAAIQFMQTESIELAVCGLHMRGFPLEKQLLDCGAAFVRQDRTAPLYRLLRLGTLPSKPGLIRSEPGSSIELEVWRIPLHRLGDFMRKVPAPLGFGKIQLQNGEEVTGFLCEPYVEHNSEDITHFGGWATAEADRAKDESVTN